MNRNLDVIERIQQYILSLQRRNNSHDLAKRSQLSGFLLYHIERSNPIQHFSGDIIHPRHQTNIGTCFEQPALYQTHFSE